MCICIPHQKKYNAQVLFDSKNVLDTDLSGELLLPNMLRACIYACMYVRICTCCMCVFLQDYRSAAATQNREIDILLSVFLLEQH